MRQRQILLLVLALAVLLGVGLLARTWVSSPPPAVPTSTPQSPSRSPTSGPAGPSASPSVPALPPLTVRPYRVIKDRSLRVIPRGEWFDLASYRVQAPRPTTHSLQLNLNVRRATGPRPTHVTVGWVIRSAQGERRVGLQTFAVPRRSGDYPFQVTHRATSVGIRGRATAQVLVQGEGTVSTRLSVAKAIVWVEPGAADRSAG